MPKINDIDLPVVTISAEYDPVKLAKQLEEEPMSPEAMIETAVYLKRQMEKASEMEKSIKVLRDRLNKFYASLKPEKRETRRTDVGQAPFSEPTETVTLTDRDKTVEMLTTEQLRITYKPDLKAMETILKPAEFDRHVTRGKKSGSVSIRETKGNENYSELDF